MTPSGGVRRMVRVASRTRDGVRDRVRSVRNAYRRQVWRARFALGGFARLRLYEDVAVASDAMTSVLQDPRLDLHMGALDVLRLADDLLVGKAYAALVDSAIMAVQTNAHVPAPVMGLVVGVRVVLMLIRASRFVRDAVAKP
jgi:hypothetical protein